MSPSSETRGDPTRRSFLKSSSAAVAGLSLLGATPLGAPMGAPVGSRRRADELRVALVGCGGRGTGAAAQALRTQETLGDNPGDSLESRLGGPVRLVTMADAFEDRLASSYGELAKMFGPDQLDVPADRQHVGFDAYAAAMAEDVDVVVLATPPGFRPEHFAHAVDRGLHVFMEKPVAVDAPGVRTVLEAAAESARRNLKVGVGLQRHHDPLYVETVGRLQQGALGEIQLLRCYWNSAGVWVKEREPGMSEMQYQMRNWYYFNWLCGDHIVEQHIHNLDVCNWIMDGHPAEAQGQGGRLHRTDPKYGEIFDHHMVEYTYGDGTKMLSQCRHIPQTWYAVSEHAHGTGGVCDVGAGLMELKDGSAWEYQGTRSDPYQMEHDVLFAAIREDRPHNEAERGAIATMTAILGRMATYSGKVVTWDEGLASDLVLAPSAYAWDAAPPTLPDEHGAYAIPVPGRTRAL